MNNNRVGALWLLAAFAIGCATAEAVRVPIARAQEAQAAAPAGPPIPKWEHYCFLQSMSFDMVKDINERINKGGADGWELVTMTQSGVVCLKRPKR